MLNIPTAKKQRRAAVPEEHFDIFEHFFHEPEVETAQPASTSAVVRDNPYAMMWFHGEAAPPSCSTPPPPDSAPPPDCHMIDSSYTDIPNVEGMEPPGVQGQGEASELGPPPTSTPRVSIS